MPNPTGTLSETRYWEHNIGQVNSDSPIVITLHWMAGDAQSMRPIFEECETPLRVVFLQGRQPSGDPAGGYSWFPDEGRFYNRPFADQASDIKAEASRIAAFVRAYRQTHPARVTAAIGKCQGGDLALALATEHPDLVNLVIACGARALPRLVQRPRDAQKPRIVMLHGTDDEVVPIQGARADVVRLRSTGYDVSITEHPGVTHCVAPEMITVIRGEIDTL